MLMLVLIIIQIAWTLFLIEQTSIPTVILLLLIFGPIVLWPFGLLAKKGKY